MKSKTLFPVFNRPFVVKGVRGKRFLLSLDDHCEYDIDDDQALILTLCDGKNTVKKIAQKSHVEIQSLQNFLRYLADIGAIRSYTSPSLIETSGPLCVVEETNPALYEVHYDITSQCNLRCPHCYQIDYLEKEADELSSSEMKDVIADLGRMNVARMAISGGEPFLRSDLHDIVMLTQEAGIAVHAIYTNGTVYDTPALEAILNLNAPVILAISLDGFSPETNDFIRGDGSFARTIRFIETVRAHRLKGSKTVCMIDTMIHPRNVRHLRKMFEFLVDLGCVDRWRASLPRTQGNYLNHYDRLHIDPGLALAAYEDFIRWYLSKALHNRMEVQIESFFQTEMIRRQEATIFNKDSLCCEYKRNTLAIKPNGDVTPCTSYTDLVVDNVRAKPLSEIWQSKRMQMIKCIPVSEVPECAECEWLYLCGGGCRKIAFSTTGSLYAKDSSICHIYRFFHERVMPLLSPFNIKFS